MQSIKSVKEIKEIRGKRVIVRAELNVPIKNGRVADDFRIRKAVQTILYLKKNGARVIVVGHIGRGGKETLKPVARAMGRFVNIGFAPYAADSKKARDVAAAMKNGTVIMLENLRRDAREKENDPAFARAVALLGDIYVNDAFSVSHRAHASIVGVPKLLPSYAGLLFEEEIKHLSLALSPKHPFLLILGGAKFETKLPLIKKYVGIADTVFVGGALANDFFRYQGCDVGKSTAEKPSFSLARLEKRKNLLLPADVVVKGIGGVSTKEPCDIAHSDTIVDAGAKSVSALFPLVARAHFILLNGPLGNYEEGFDGATKEILKQVAKSKAFSIIGGGDTVALVTKLKMEKKFTFVSTGGGAMLAFLAKGTLPGIKALKK